MKPSRLSCCLIALGLSAPVLAADPAPVVMPPRPTVIPPTTPLPATPPVVAPAPADNADTAAIKRPGKAAGTPGPAGKARKKIARTAKPKPRHARG